MAQVLRKLKHGSGRLTVGITVSALLLLNSRKLQSTCSNCGQIGGLALLGFKFFTVVVPATVTAVFYRFGLMF